MKIYVDLDHVDITEYTQIESGEYNTNKINFIFTPEYKDLVKVAIFGCKLDTEEPKFYKIYLSDDSCYLPSEVTSASDVISIGVYAFNVENGELKLRYSPTPVKTIVYEGSFREEAENASSPTPTEIEQIMSRIISLEELTSDLNTRVEALENKACDLDSIKEDVETLKSDVEGISGRLDTAESDIDDLEGDIANTYSKTEVDTLLGSKVDTTTFNSSQAAQDEKIAKAELILSQLPKVTGEGTNFSLSPTIEYDLEVESLLGDTIQDGTPSPDTPIDIQVVTGTQEVEVCGNNLFNKNNATLIDGFVSTGTNKFSSATNSQKSLVIPVKPSTQYSIIGIERPSCNFGLFTEYPVADVSIGTQVSSFSTTSKKTFTTGSSDKYAVFLIKGGNETYGYDNIMFYYGNETLSYEPYTSQTYTLHLGDLELAKIPNTTYLDTFKFSNNKWYKGKKVEKIASYNGETISTDYISTTGQLTTGAKVYYGIQEQDVEITNTTLLSDLEYIRTHSMSYSGTTNISSSGDLPIVISASAIKQLS